MTPAMITDWSRISELARGRLCFFVRGFDGGGAQRDAILLANAVSRLGLPAAIVTLDGRGPLGALVEATVPVLDLGRGRKLRLALALGAFRRLLAARPMVLISSEAAANGLVILASRLIPASRRPSIVLREVASPQQARSNDPFWQNRLGYRAAPLSYPLADLVVTFTAGVRSDLIIRFGVPARKVVSLGTNAVLTPAMRQRIAANPRRPKPGLIISVGRLSPEKDPRTLIEAFALLRRTYSARLVMVGDGPERRGLEQRIAALGLQDDIELAGFHADPLPLLAEAALFVCSSRHEGLGNAIIEAMACGVPIVATDAPHGPREILEGGRFGRLVPVGDVASLAAAMASAVQEKSDEAALAARASAFSVEAAGVRFVEILRAAGIIDANARALEVN